jgi:hypothetical protein
MTGSAAILDPQQPVGDAVRERLRKAAGAAQSWDVVHRPNTASAFQTRVRATSRALKVLETDLAAVSFPGESDDENQALFRSAVHDLRASTWLLRSAITGLPDSPRAIASLPRVISPRNEEPRVAAASELYLRAVEGGFEAAAFRTFVDELQAHEAMTAAELWSFPAFLKFILLEMLLDASRTFVRASAPRSGTQVIAYLKSLSTIGQIDWETLIEPLIAFDATLRRDPAGSYSSMDFESREQYRRRVAFVARYSDYTECEVAQSALDLADKSTFQTIDNPRLRRRLTHVGYYLFDKGFPTLAASVGFHPPLIERLRASVRSHADELYVTGIQGFTILICAAVVFPSLPDISGLTGLIIALIILVWPASQVAVDLVNNLVTATFKPEPLPKLDFSDHVPVECTTLVAVPSLLLSENQVRELVTNLEIHFLGNRVPNIYFAILSDLPDSISKPHENDSHPLVELAMRLIEELNVKYPSRPFLFLHRHRIFNSRQDLWMGWERKRGKLLDLNRLIVGSFDAFPLKTGRIDVLREVRYVLTLDSDTQLPRETAVRLIGAIAHPLNQAIINPKSRIVTQGYGILQPRVSVAIRSASRSRLAAVYSGQTGYDLYTRAVSDAYQDLFGEGVFTGKGIYEIATFHAVLEGRFPRNSLLSHDLIEGAYARAGLVTDTELIDDYPSRYSAYSRRKHRWMRGDWQILQWLFSRVPEESGHWVPNPISYISRWKLFDNLRRSLVNPFLFLLFVAGWFGLPGGPLYWTIVPLMLMIFPSSVQLGMDMTHAILDNCKGGASEALSRFWHTAFITLLELIFLPNQTLIALDAMFRSLVRRFITGKRLLEWETAAQSEIISARRAAADRYLVVCLPISFSLAVLIYLFAAQHIAIRFASPILLMWALAKVVAGWLDKPPRQAQKKLSSKDSDFLFEHALRIWHFFHDFSTERHNYLIPDNVEEDGFYEASRISPTNVGMLFNARQAACELGFLTVPEFVTLTEKSLAALVRLDKFKGHLYNWYDTRTLKPLDEAPFVSSVDSGNLVASLYTLRGGALDLLRKPLLSRQIFKGLGAHWRMMESRSALAAPSGASLPDFSASISEWITWLSTAEAALSAAVASPDARQEDSFWLTKLRNRITALLAFLRNYMPWMLCEYAPLREVPQLALDVNEGVSSLEDALSFTEALNERLGSARVALTEQNCPHLTLAENLRATLPSAHKNLRALTERLRGIARQAEHLAEDTDFAFLVHPTRKILSIGYDTGTKSVHESCYDMLASEARIASFLAIAHGDLRQKGWFKLARQHAYAFGRFLLYSWSGTMFEYLMPALWMRNYPETLLSRTLKACVQVQRAFGRSLGIPWGISESGSSRRDYAGHYLYHAYGIPQIALLFQAPANRVISPYSTFLALSVDSREALRNLRRMESAGWVGPYGFYEAADYEGPSGDAILVREWMAHHQGMSLLAATNLLRGNIVQRWFHFNTVVRSTDLLLQEIPVRKAVLKAKLKEFGPVILAPDSLNQ